MTLGSANVGWVVLVVFVLWSSCPWSAHLTSDQLVPLLFPLNLWSSMFFSLAFKAMNLSKSSEMRTGCPIHGQQDTVDVPRV